MCGEDGLKMTRLERTNVLRGQARGDKAQEGNCDEGTCLRG